MTFAIICCTGAIICLIVACFLLFKRVDQLTDISANLGLEVARFKDEMDKELKAVKEGLSQVPNGRELAEVLERKWEEATQALQNFDPYRTEGDK